MSKFATIFGGLAVVLCASTAHAQATRTWVTGAGGSDANPCSRTAPCATFAGAISKTATGGEINCIEPGGFGALTITKSITIDCHDVFASVLHSAVTGFTVNYDAFAAADTARRVRIRNINFNGAGATLGVNGIRIIGGAQSSGSSVMVEDCLMDGSSNRGISDERTNGGELTVTNTTVRNMGGNGITVAPVSGAVQIKAMLKNVRIHNTNNGISSGAGVRMFVSGTVVSGITGAGIIADGTGGASEINVNNSETAQNGTGLQTAVGGTIRIANTDISFNGTGITNAGSVLSFGNNRISGNTAAGAAPTNIGADSHDKGQQ